MNLRFLCFKPGLGTLDHFGGDTGGSWIIWATWVRHGSFCGQLGSNLGPPFWGNRAHTQTNQFLCLVMTAGMFSANMFRGTPATKIPQKKTKWSTSVQTSLATTTWRLVEQDVFFVKFLDKSESCFYSQIIYKHLTLLKHHMEKAPEISQSLPTFRGGPKQFFATSTYQGNS